MRIRWDYIGYFCLGVGLAPEHGTRYVLLWMGLALFAWVMAATRKKVVRPVNCGAPPHPRGPLTNDVVQYGCHSSEPIDGCTIEGCTDPSHYFYTVLEEDAEDQEPDDEDEEDRLEERDEYPDAERGVLG